MEKFLEKIAEILDSEQDITMESVLEDIDEWDSLSLVSYIAVANSVYGKKLNAGDVRRARTVHDLYDMVK